MQTRCHQFYLLFLKESLRDQVASILNAESRNVISRISTVRTFSSSIIKIIVKEIHILQMQKVRIFQASNKEVKSAAGLKFLTLDMMKG